MYVHFILMFFLSFLCLLPRLGVKIRYKDLLKISFCLIWVYSALRYDYGPDYKNYLTMFNEINRGLDFNYYKHEIGFYFLLKIFPNFYSFIIFTSTLMCVSFYSFINKYIDPKHYSLSILFIFIHQSVLIGNFTAMRTAFTLYIFLFAFRFLLKRKIIPYIICILLASQFHLFSIVLLPMYFISDKRISINKYYLICISSFIAFVIGFIAYRIIISTALKINILSGYTYYFDERINDRTFGLGNLFVGGFFILSTILAGFSLLKEHNRKLRVILKMSIVYFLVKLMYLDMEGRVSIYFALFFMVTVSVFQNRFKRHVYLYNIYLFVYMLYITITSLMQDYSITFLEYKTIFEANNL